VFGWGRACEGGNRRRPSTVESPWWLPVKNRRHHYHSTALEESWCLGAACRRESKPPSARDESVGSLRRLSVARRQRHWQSAAKGESPCLGGGLQVEGGKAFAREETMGSHERLLAAHWRRHCHQQWLSSGFCPVSVPQ